MDMTIKSGDIVRIDPVYAPQDVITAFFVDGVLDRVKVRTWLTEHVVDDDSRMMYCGIISRGADKNFEVYVTDYQLGIAYIRDLSVKKCYLVDIAGLIVTERMTSGEE